MGYNFKTAMFLFFGVPKRVTAMKYTYHAHAICQLPNNSIQHFDGIINRVAEIGATNYKEVKKAIAAEMGANPEGVIIDSLTLIGSHDNG